MRSESLRRATTEAIQRRVKSLLNLTGGLPIRKIKRLFRTPLASELLRPQPIRSRALSPVLASTLGVLRRLVAGRLGRFCARPCSFFAAEREGVAGSGHHCGR